MEKNYNDLITKYKHLFTNDNRQPLTMFGFECGDGWYNLIAQLIDQIDSYLLHKHKGVPEGFAIVQVKEKFGGLRFYIHGGDTAIYELIRFAEEQSYRTCEYCGSNQNIMRSKRWIITACEQCTQLHDHLKTKEWVKVD